MWAPNEILRVEGFRVLGLGLDSLNLQCAADLMRCCAVGVLQVLQLILLLDYALMSIADIESVGLKPTSTPRA